MTEQELNECEAEVANHRQLNPAQLEKLFAAVRATLSAPAEVEAPMSKKASRNKHAD